MTKLTSAQKDHLDALWRKAESGEEFAEIARMEEDFLQANEMGEGRFGIDPDSQFGVGA